MLAPLYKTGGTYANKYIKHTRLDYQAQYPDCLCGGSDTSPARHQGLAVFPLGARDVVHQSAINKMIERHDHGLGAHQALTAMMDVAKMLVDKESARYAISVTS